MKVMKHVAAGLLCALALRAEPVLLVHDATGALLRQAPAVLRTQGEDVHEAAQREVGQGGLGERLVGGDAAGDGDAQRGPRGAGGRIPGTGRIRDGGAADLRRRRERG